MISAGRPINLVNSGVRACCTCSACVCGGVCLDFSSLLSIVSPFFFLPLGVDSIQTEICT